MKFKILKGTDTFKKLIELREKCTSATNSAKELITEFGGTKYCANNSPFVIAGGISAVMLDGKPQKWKMAFGEKNLFFPSKTNHLDLKKIDDLPLVLAEELNNILGYTDQHIPIGGGKSRWQVYPNVNWKNDDYILISMDEKSNFTTNSDMIEITISDFKKLTN